MAFDPIPIAALGLLGIILVVVARADRRAEKNERRLLELLRHFGMEDVRHPAPSGEVLALLAKGQKTAAVRRYRQDTRLGLKAALEAIESFPTPASAGAREG